MSQNFAGISGGYNSEAIFKYRDENMCSKWKNIVEKEFMGCSVKGITNQNGNYRFTGTTKNYLNILTRSLDVYLQYWAPNKPDRRNSFNGSGLPFPSEEVAFDNTSNKGVIRILGGEFTFHLDYPNSYYSHMGKKLNPPLVKFRFCDSSGRQLTDIHTIILGHSIPFRSLSFPNKRWTDGPMFYNNTEMPPCRSQSQILMDSAYPEKTMEEPSNFWGTKPPL